jgi:hypothetical protein
MIDIVHKIGLHTIENLKNLLGLELISISSLSGGTTSNQAEFLFEDKINLFFKDKNYKVKCVTFTIDSFNTSQHGIPIYDLQFSFSDGTFNMEDLNLFSKGMRVSINNDSNLIQKIEIYGIKQLQQIKQLNEDEEKSRLHGFPTFFEDKKNYNTLNIDLDCMVLFVSSNEENLLIMYSGEYRIIRVLFDSKEIKDTLSRVDFNNYFAGYVLQHVVD